MCILISNLEEKYNIEIEDFTLREKSNILKPIIRNIKFTSEDLIEEINGKSYIKPLLFLAKSNNPFKSNERKFPIDFIAKWQDKHTVSISLPEGYTVEKIPEPIAIGLPDNLGVFKYQVTQKGNKLNTVSILQFNESIIAPKYYPALKDFYGKVVAKQTEKIILTKQ